MTQEQKAKAYDEALERAKKFHTLDSNNSNLKAVLEQIFPELRESEDERIIQFFAELATDACGGPGQEYYEELGLNYDKVMAWLEKRKINTEGDFGRGYDCGYQAGYAVAMNEMKPKVATATLDSEKHEEQKQTDLPAGFYYIDLDGNKYYSKEFRYGDMKVKVGEQKPAWSEEDEIKLEDVINDLETLKDWIRKHDTGWKNNPGLTLIDKRISWLKSLRPHWKPSEEHLSALLAIFNDPNNIGSQTCQLALTDLYEQLKNL